MLMIILSKLFVIESIYYCSLVIDTLLTLIIIIVFKFIKELKILEIWI